MKKHNIADEQKCKSNKSAHQVDSRGAFIGLFAPVRNQSS